MSGNVGLYIDGDWYTEVPPRRTLRLIRPTKWYWRALKFLGFWALCTGLVYLNVWDTHRIWAHYNYPPPYRLTETDLNVSMGLVAVSLMLVGMYVIYFALWRPVRKLGCRNALIEQGKLFPKDSTVVRMVMTKEIISNWEQNPQNHWSITEAINEFAAGMFAATVKFEDRQWYLDASAGQQAEWQGLTSLEGGSPLDRLSNISWNQQGLLDNIDRIIREQSKQRKAEFARQLGVAQEKGTEQKAAWEATCRQIAELQTQIQYLNTKQVIPVT